MNEVDIRIAVNRYLFHELDIEGDEHSVSMIWPFRLQEICDVVAEQPDVRLFEFNFAHETYLAEAGKSLSFWLAGGTTVADIRLQVLGEMWVERHNAIDLDTARASDRVIPLIAERQRSIEEIALRALGRAKRVQILEGLYFPVRKRYLALVEDLDTGSAFVVGSEVNSIKVKHSDAAPWRRLNTAIGEMLGAGKLAGFESPDVADA